MFRWRCPCGGEGNHWSDNQSDVENNAMQHRLRQSVPHPLAYVIDQHGSVVSRMVANASGPVGRHWGWTD